jgi:hypothetical protein
MPMSLSDTIATVSLILTIVGLVIGIILGWYSSDAFRRVVQSLATIVRIKFFRQHFFLTVYIPILLLALATLYRFGRLSATSALGAYGLWVTAWAIILYRRRKDLTGIVSCLLGWPESESGVNGIQHVFYSDGVSRVVPFHEQMVRSTNTNDGQYYMYFKIRDDVVQRFRDAPSVLLGVEFFDFSEPEYTGHGFDLQYDSTDDDNPRPLFKHSKPIMFDNTGRWNLKLIEIRDGRFARRQQEIADFRVNCQLRPAPHKVLRDLIVRRIVAIALNE